MVIPESIEGCPVTSIDPDSDKEYINIKSLSIPKSVNFVYDEEAGLIANGLYNLEKVTVDPENETFGSEDGMFYNKKTHTIMKYYGKSGMKEIIIPEYIQSIRAKAFSGAENINSLVLGEGLEEIRGGAFKGAENLKQVVIPESVNILASGAFLESCKVIRK